MGWLLFFVLLATLDPFAAHGEKALVLLFIRADCPISNRYAPEIQRIQKVYQARGVDFRLVYAERLSTAAREKHRRDYGYSIPALDDPDRHYREKAQVRTTPEAAVFVRGQLVYRGRIDNRYVDFGKARAAPTQRDLDAVLGRIVKGQAVAFHETRAIGCAMENAP